MSLQFLSRRWIVAAMTLVCLTGSIVALLLMTNPAPAVPVISADEAAGSRPYVIKLHARWCPICMVTKDAWQSVQDAYSGRVRFVVFDFTNAATTEASHREARRLGLDVVFEEYSGETGTVLVLHGGSKEVKHALHGHRTTAEYRAAIDEILAIPQK